MCSLSHPLLHQNENECIVFFLQKFAKIPGSSMINLSSGHLVLVMGFVTPEKSHNLSVLSLVTFFLSYLLIWLPPLPDCEQPAGGATFCSSLYSQHLVQFPADVG